MGIDDRAPFFSHWIRWTPPSFQWHNPVSAWLSLRVRASDYRWCPNIDCFLYIHGTCFHETKCVHLTIQTSHCLLPPWDICRSSKFLSHDQSSPHAPTLRPTHWIVVPNRKTQQNEQRLQVKLTSQQGM